MSLSNKVKLAVVAPLKNEHKVTRSNFVLHIGWNSSFEGYATIQHDPHLDVQTYAAALIDREANCNTQSPSDNHPELENSLSEWVGRIATGTYNCLFLNLVRHED